MPDQTELRSAYLTCRRIAAAHGRTYFLATRLLPEARRPAIHALYAFARTVDDIVDTPGVTDAPRRLDTIESLLHRRGRVADAGRSAGAGDGAEAPDETLRAVFLALHDTIERYRIPVEHFSAFLTSMRMDVVGDSGFRAQYSTMDELRQYMYGSAAVIGLQLLPVLGTVGSRGDAEPAAATLGEAFQLTNFLRDVGEDLDRGRIYLPTDELAAFGVDADLLAHCRRTGVVDVRVRRALAHFIAVDRSWYRIAESGIPLLEPRVRPAIRAAFTLYAQILDRIEESGYAVFDRRIAVPRPRRARVAAAEAIRSGLPARAAAPRAPSARAARRPEFQAGCHPR